MAVYTVGLDVHSKKTTYVIQDESGNVRGRGEFATSPEGFLAMRKQHALPDATRVGLETGTSAFFAARTLMALGICPVVIDAREVRLKARRRNQKSDGRDAFEICDGLRRDIYSSIVHVPGPLVRELREVLSRRRHFVRVQTGEINAAKRLLRAAGLGTLSRNLTSAKAWQKLKDGVGSEEHLESWIALHEKVWQSAGERVAELDARLAEIAKSFEADVERLQAIRGVGPVVALTAIAVFSDIKRFPTSKHAASYAGLVPSAYQAGEKDCHGRITKRGSAELRAMLCQAAHHARHPAHQLNPYFVRLTCRKGYKPAVTAVAHRLCRIFFALLRRQAVFDETKLGVEKGPFKKTTERVYRLKSEEKSQRA
jgi:transposase